TLNYQKEKPQLIKNILKQIHKILQKVPSLIPSKVKEIPSKSSFTFFSEGKIEEIEGKWQLWFQLAILAKFVNVLGPRWRDDSAASRWNFILLKNKRCYTVSILNILAHVNVYTPFKQTQCRVSAQ
ncbi:unnamed protein product, partial [Meganyctiphanes norvegica]